MKKLFRSMLALVVATSFVLSSGCGGGQPIPKEPPKDPTSKKDDKAK